MPDQILWLVLRLISIPVATLALVFGKKVDMQLSVPSLLLSPWYQYDAVHYVQIVRNGYRGDITSGFHPLFPLMGKILDLVIHQPLISLMVVSSLAGFLLTVTFYRLVIMDHDETTARTATALLLCWPAAASLFVPYTESLFLLLSVWCVLAARRGRFWLAGLSGCFASLTRQNGLFLMLPLAWEIWEASDRNWRNLMRDWKRWPAIALVPVGYGLWIAYRALAINDVRPDFSTPQHFIFSVMISPSHYQVFPNHQFLPPWLALWKALQILLRGGLHWSAYGDALLAALFLGMMIFSWRHLRTSYRIYSLAIGLVALSYHTGSSVNPYTALPRHLFLAFPVFVGIANRYKFHRLPFVLIILATCQLLVLCCYVWETWVL
jgi:Gpi18-like mannosyltransferase